jgi:WD40 repeat protein
MSLTIQKYLTLSGHESPVYALENFDSRSFFSGGGDRIVSCWNLEEQTSKGIINTASAIYSLKYIPSKNLLLVGVSEGGVHVIDLIQKKEIHFLNHHEKGVFDIQYSEKFNLVICVGGDGVISSWSGDNFTLVKTLKLCEEKVRAIRIEKDEKYMAVGCGDGTIRMLIINTLEEITQIPAHTTSVNSLCFHPYMNFLLSGGRDAHLNIWRTEDFKLMQSIPAHNYAVYSITFCQEKNIFITASRDKTIKVWDADNFNFLSRIDLINNEAHKHSVNKIIWVKDLLISASDDKMIMVWKITK